MEAFLYNHKSWDDTALKEENKMERGTHGRYYIRYPRRLRPGGGLDLSYLLWCLDQYMQEILSADAFITSWSK